MDTNRQNTLSFTYDAVGQLLSAGDQYAGYDYTYDRLGRMITSDASITGLTPYSYPELPTTSRENPGFSTDFCLKMRTQQHIECHRSYARRRNPCITAFSTSICG
jgi:YD repeat-containing protein